MKNGSVLLLALYIPGWTAVVSAFGCIPLSRQRLHRGVERSGCAFVALRAAAKRGASSSACDSTASNPNNDENSNDKEPVHTVDALLYDDSSDYGDDDEEEDWTPDFVKAKQRRENARIYAEKIQSASLPSSSTSSSSSKSTSSTASSADKPSKRPSPYTEEEEDIIAAMGGKTFHEKRKREVGFLGDSTLREIATDYSVPICYLADVLCLWGVPVPIQVDDRLGDLVTGEKAFALLEAVNSLDMAALHDRYSNTNLLQLCYEWDIPIQKAFEMAMKEGWSLPFGVHTCLRVEQEDELIRVLAQDLIRDSEEEEEEEDYIDVN